MCDGKNKDPRPIIIRIVRRAVRESLLGLKCNRPKQDNLAASDNDKTIQNTKVNMTNQWRRYGF